MLPRVLGRAQKWFKTAHADSRLHKIYWQNQLTDILQSKSRYEKGLLLIGITAIAVAVYFIFYRWRRAIN